MHLFSYCAAVLCFALTLSACGACQSSGRATEPTAAAPGDEAYELAGFGESLPSSARLTYRGMTFAHEGYDGYNGYGGTTVGPSLDSLLKLGVNALAIVPYTFMREHDKPVPLPIPQREGTERDVAVIHSIKEAHARGLAVMLKPQIWLGGGHWPGDIEFRSDAEWEAWAKHYRDYILHYARMAEAHDVAALCIGTELVHTTLERPADWRATIDAIREVYGGTLTYAANWGEEFENLSFWDDLDAVGLNSYYPLSRKQNPTNAELLAGAREWMTMANNVAAKAGKPLWLTEVGYRSAKQAWINPHAGTDGRPVSESCQARSYAAMLRATEEAPLLDGIFVWKWPSYLGRVSGGSWHGDNRVLGTGFCPGGKLAGGVLGEYYLGTKVE